uniref:Apolipoprotein D n=1 Tax=Tetraodon nigroviridis TaxID=99883 RepID=H3CJ67_TETNG
MNAVQVLPLALLAALAAHAQVIKPGRCPRPAVQQEFDAARYLGTWYEIQRLPHRFQTGQCSTASYSLKSPGVVGVLNRELRADGTVYSISGTAVAEDPSEPAKLAVSFYEILPYSPYWILSTDYVNTALVYSCTDILRLFHVDFAWILSRTRTLPESTVMNAKETFAKNNIDVSRMIDTKQEGCDKYL